MVIMGDLNCYTLSQSKRCTMDLLTSIEECNLKQLVNSPTHVTNHSQSLIDLLLVSHPDKVKKVVCIPLTDSDHMMIDVIYNELKAVQHANINNKCERL